MAENRRNLLTTLGFLSFVDQRPHGVLGGFLIVNTRGRPLEFHCSTPVQTNRAQEILYGPTLRPFLFGELVGKTLIEHAKLPVDAILVDSSDTLDLRKAVNVPVAVVADAEETGMLFAKQPPGLSDLELSAPSLRIGSFLLTISRGYGEDSVALEDMLGSLVGDLDLREPFERIRAALDEAQRMSA